MITIIFPFSSLQYCVYLHNIVYYCLIQKLLRRKGHAMTQDLFNQIIYALLDMNIIYHEDTLPIVTQLINEYPDYLQRYNDTLPNEDDFDEIEVSGLQLQLLQCKINKAIKKLKP